MRQSQESNRRLLRESLPKIAPGYGDSAHDKAAERIARDMETRYEIRADNPDPAKAGEWAVFAIDPNCHARRVAYTTDKAEAEAVLLGLRAAPCMFAALEAMCCTLEAAWAEKSLTAPKYVQCQLGEAVKAARAALARAKGGEA